MSTMVQAKSMLASLFDFSFTEFVTTRLIRVLYVLGVVVAGALTMIYLITAFQLGGAGALIALLVLPILFLGMVMYFRVLLELLVVIFRMADDISRIANRDAAG